MKVTKRIASWFLVLLMAFTILPTDLLTIFAAQAADTESVVRAANGLIEVPKGEDASDSVSAGTNHGTPEQRQKYIINGYENASFPIAEIGASEYAFATSGGPENYVSQKSNYTGGDNMGDYAIVSTSEKPTKALLGVQGFVDKWAVYGTPPYIDANKAGALGVMINYEESHSGVYNYYFYENGKGPGVISVELNPGYEFNYPRTYDGTTTGTNWSADGKTFEGGQPGQQNEVQYGVTRLENGHYKIEIYIFRDWPRIRKTMEGEPGNYDVQNKGLAFTITECKQEGDTFHKVGNAVTLPFSENSMSFDMGKIAKEIRDPMTEKGKIFCIEETTTANGYELMSPIYFRVDETETGVHDISRKYIKSISVWNASTGAWVTQGDYNMEFSIENKKVTPVKIVKINEDGEVLSDAVFTCETTDNAVAGDHTLGTYTFTGKNGINYKFEEKTAPVGYEALSGYLQIEVDARGAWKLYKSSPDDVVYIGKGVNAVNDEKNVIYVVDKETVYTGDLTIEKNEEGTGKKLAGAEFVLTHKDGKTGEMQYVKASQTAILGEYVFEAFVGNGEGTSFITAENGRFTVKELPLGTKSAPAAEYTYKEIVPPEGYVQNSNNSATVTLEKEQTKEVAVENKPQLGNIELLKTDADAEAPLADAEFTLYEKKADGGRGKEVAVYTTGSDGKIVFEELKIGEYLLVETKAPAGYAENPAQYTVVVAADPAHGETALVTVNGAETVTGQPAPVIRNNPDPVTVTLHKLWKNAKGESGDLQGAAFEVRDENGAVVYNNLVSGANGEATFRILIGKTYTVQETSAPAGYDKSEKTWRLRLAADGKTAEIEEDGVWKPLADNTLTVENPLSSAQVMLKKHDRGNDILLGNVTFTVLGGKYNEQAFITGADTGLTDAITDLEYNVVYRITEKAPAGYTANQAVFYLRPETVEGREGLVVKLYRDADCTQSLTGGDVALAGGTITVENDPVTANVKIRKVDEKNQPLSGAVFTLDGVALTESKDKDGNVWFVLPALQYKAGGKVYTLHEQAPEGYNGAEDFYLKVNADGSVALCNADGSTPAEPNKVALEKVNSDYVVTVENAAKSTVARLQKVDSESGLRIKAAFDWTAVNTVSGQRVESGSWISQEAAADPFLFKIGRTYTFVEREVPGGYANAPVTFTVTANTDGTLTVSGAQCEKGDSYTTITAENTPKTLQAELTKTDKNGLQLDGAQFTVTEDGQPVLTGAPAGKLRFDVVYGKVYAITETTAPEGYNGLKETIKFQLVYDESSKKLNIDWMGTNADGALTAVIDQSETRIAMTAENTPIVGDLQILKTGDGGKDLPDVTYRLYRSDRQLTAEEYATEEALSAKAEKLTNQTTGQTTGADAFITDENGKVIIKTVAYGWYYAVEAAAPYAYDRTVEPQYIGNIAVMQGRIEKVLTNRLTEGKLEVTKTGDGGTKLAGAVFEIYKGAEGVAFADAEPIGRLTTGEGGIGVLENIGAGKYWAKEIAPPAGYDLPAEGSRVTYLGEVRFGSEFTGPDGVVTLKASISNSLLNAKVFVKKVDENGEVLAAAENPFRVEASDGSAVGMTKEGDGLWSFEAIYGINYTVTEPNAPQGYDAAEGSAVVTLQEVKENGLHKVRADKAFSVDEKGLTVTVANSRVRADLKLTKYGDKTLNPQEGESLLDGVVFALYKENPNAVPGATVIAQVTTGKTYDGISGAETNGSTGVALIKNVEYGTYYAKEISAPQAYQVDSGTVYTLTVSQTGVTAEQTVHDPRVGASLVVDKQDAEGNSLTGTGARFTIYQVRETEDSILQNIADWFAGLSGDAFSETMTAVATNVKAGDIVAVGAGTYIAVETTPPDGYTLNAVPSAPIQIGQGDHGKLFTAVMKNDKQTAQVTVQKTDDAWRPLNGASVTVRGSDGSSRSLPANGNTLTFEAVWGVTYTVSENAAPEGYNGLPAAENDFTFTLSHDGKKIVAQSRDTAQAVQEIAFKGSDNVRLAADRTLQLRNTQILGSIELVKTGEKQTENGLAQKPLADVYYAVYTDAQGVQKLEGPETLNGVAGLWKTNGDGKIVIEKVPYGTYYAQEIAAPKGYNVDTAIREIGSIDKTGEALTASYANTLIRGSITLEKTDKDTGKALAGVTFELWRRHDMNNLWDAMFGQDVLVSTLQTDAQGKITFTGVPAGSYYVVEKDVPAGYDPAAIHVKTDVPGVIAVEGDTLSVAVTNEKIKADLNLTKTGDGNQKLAGVTFQLYQVSVGGDIPVGGPFTTGSNGLAEWKDLEVGGYYVIETAAPDAYVLPEGGIRYPETGVWTVEDARTGKQVLNHTITNELVKGSIGLTKVAEDGVMTLENAWFELYRKDGDVYTKVREAAATDSKGKLVFTELGIGEYYVKETQAPEGYNRLEGYISVGSISRSQPHVGAEVNAIVNSKVLANLRLHKVGGLEGGEMANLSGVRFQLYDEKGNKVRGEAETGLDGIAEWTNIPVGRYYALETYAPPEYYLSAAQMAKRYEFVVTSADNGLTLTYAQDVENYLVDGSVEIIKKDAQSGEGLDGAVFTLWKKGAAGAADKSYGQKTTANGGVARWDGLPYGDYYVVEDGAPYGYIPLTARVDITGTLTRNNDALRQEITNEKLHANLIVNKTDESGAPLEGVTFQLYKKNAEGVFEAVTGETAVTDTAGEAVFEKLEAGFYYVKETIAPDRFKLDSEKAWPSENGVEIKTDRVHVTVDVTNELVPVTVIVDKQEEDDSSKKLAGAQFTLYGKDAAGNFTVVKDSGTTDENGALTFTEGLYAGETYLLKETKAPYGYAIIGEGAYTITPQRNGVNAVTVTQQVSNRKILGTATIHKVGTDGALEGATFELLRTYLNGGVQMTESWGEMTTDSSGVINWTGLPVGSYAVKETAAPDDYQLPEERPVYQLGEIKAHGDSLTGYTEGNAIRNLPVQGSITLTKVDAENTGRTLAGAVFKLQKKNADGNYIDVAGSTQTTGTDGIARWTQLGAGEYKTVEVSAPYGYQLTADSEKTFVIARDGDRNIELTATVTNQLIRGSAQLKKVGEGADANGLAGVTFQLYRTYTKNGSTVTEAVSAKTTDNTGILNWENLPVGAYYVKETAAPAGYVYNPETVYTLGTIARNGDSLTMERPITNTPVSGSVTLTKTDENSQALPGAEFTLYKGTYPSGAVVEAKTTGADGVAQWQKLAAGSYYILETKAPHGYDPIKGVVWTGVVAQNSDDPTLHFADSLTVPNGVIYGSIKLKKTGEGEDAAGLARVGFDLYHKDGGEPVKVGDTRYTNENGVIEWGAQPVGEYYAVEVSAPDNYVLPEGDAARITLGSIRSQGDKLESRYTSPVTNTLVKGEITVIKYDNETAEIKDGAIVAKDGQSVRYLSGAGFTLYRRETTGDILVASDVTGTDGKLHFTNLPVGDYYLVETSAPVGYQPIEGIIEIGNGKDWDITREVTLKTIGVGNDKIYGKAELMKTDATGKPLAGVTFDLYRDGKKLEGYTKTTGADGILTWDKLEIGAYKVVETAAPEDYQLSDPRPEYELGAITQHGQVLSLTGNKAITNRSVQGSIVITKVDAADKNVTLAGAEFQLYKENAQGVYELYGQPQTTEADGVAKWQGLGVGKYQIQEIAAPYGYTLNTQQPTFTIARDGVKDIVLTATVENSKFYGTAKLKKVGQDEDAAGLAGVTFQLWRTYLNGEGKSITEKVGKEETTNGSGVITWDNLEVGDYHVIETSAPLNYQQPDVTRKYALGSIAKEGDEANLCFDTPITNDLVKGSIIVTKTDAETEKPLAGAAFDLYRRGTDGPVANDVTDDEGQITFGGLVTGDYYLKETNPPEGYAPITGEIEIGVKGADDITRSQLTAYAVVENDRIYGSAEIEKLGEDGKPLAGVTFELHRVYKDTDVVIGVKTTGTDGKVVFSPENGDRLEIGSYYAVETAAPDNYVLPQGEAAKHELGAIEKQGDRLTLTGTKAIKNTLVHGSITVVKYDGATSGENKTYLEGAEFELYRKDAAGDKLVDIQTTGADGKAVFDGLVTGSYYLKETKAPQGYDPITANIKVGAITREVTALTKEVPNGVIYGEVVLTKTGDAGALLEGAVFQLYRKGTGEAGADEALTTAETNAAGVASWDRLPIGVYYVKEVAVDGAYKLDPNKVWQAGEITAQGQVLTVQAENELVKGAISLNKTDAETGAALAEAEFDLYRREAAGSVKVNTEKLVTNEKGVILVEGLPVGDYYFIETKAPAGYELPVGQAAIFEVGTAGSNDITREAPNPAPVKAENNKIYGKAALHKTGDASEKDAKGLAGVVFQLYDEDGNEVQQARTTNESGDILWSGLPIGTYYAQEVSAPEHYQLDTTKKYWFAEITEQGQTVSVKAENRQVLGSVTLRKTDAADNAALAGAEFALYRRVENGQDILIGTMTTGDTGSVTFRNLVVGDYYAKEKTPPIGYEPIAGIIEIGKVNGNDITRGVLSVSETVKNHKIYGSAKLVKTGDGGAPLADVSFQLYDEAGSPVQEAQTTGKNGEIVWNGLPIGRYYAKEVSAPANYELDTETAHWFDAITTQGQTVEITVTNQLVKGSIKVVKIDGKTQKPLAGAEFDLYRTGEAKAIKHGVTNAQGEILFEDLVTGHYYLRETKAPAGYAQIAGDIEVGDITREKRELSIKVPNGVIYGSAEIRKTGDGGAPLAGVTFQLYRKGENGAADETLESQVTGSDGVAVWDMLTVGTYYAKETAAPKEYQLDTSAVHELGTISANVTDKDQKQTLSIQVSNVLVKGAITVVKTDAEDGLPLAGAEFDLYRRGEPAAVARGETNEDGRIVFDNLTVGDYYLVETKAPAGYEPITGIIEIGKSGEDDITRSVRSVTQTVENHKIYGSAKLVKTGDGGALLAGVAFQLYDEAGNQVQEAQTTGENGEIVWKELPIGRYYAKEVSAPANYELDTETAHWFDAITTQGQTVSITVTNRLVKGAITVVKLDAGTQEPVYLQGAAFDLYRVGETAAVAHGVTDIDGRFVFSDLPVGEYYLVETAAPDGYILPTEPIKVGVISRSNVELHSEVGNHKLHGSVQVLKVDAEDAAKTLGGAVFGIYTTHEAALAKSEDYLATQVTGTDSGVANFTGLEKGVYYIAELTAPYGYQLDNGVYTAEITYNEQVVPITVSDELIRGNIELIKTGKNGVPLDGATFEIYDAAGKVWDTVTTTNGGKAGVTGLPVGTWYARETVAPPHYQLLTQPVELGTIVTHGQTLTSTISNEKIKHHITTEVINGSTSTPKVTVDDGENGKTLFQPADENYLLRQVVIQKLNADGTVAEETVYNTQDALTEFQDGEKTIENVTQDWHVIVTYERQYRVTYHGNGNTAGSAPVDPASPYWAGSKTNNVLGQGDLAKQNYSFLGWAESEEAANAAIPVIRYPVGAAITDNIQRDYDLWAVWGVDGQYDVLYTPGTGEGEVFSQGFRFEGDGYTVLDNVPGDANTPSFTKEHYHFAGWTTEETTVTANVGDNCTQPPRQVVYVAQWEEDETYRLTYHANNESIGGAGGAYGDPTAYYAGDKWTTLPVTDGNMNYTTPGYRFYGWNTQADGKGAFYTPGSIGVIKGDTHLYAMWTTGPVALTPEAAIQAEHNYFLDVVNREGQLVQPDLRGIVFMGDNPVAALIANSYGSNVYQLTGTITVQRTFIPRKVEEPAYEDIDAAYPTYQEDLKALDKAKKELDDAQKAEQDAKLILEGKDKTALLAEAERKAAEAQDRVNTLHTEIDQLTQALANAAGIDTSAAQQALADAQQALAGAQNAKAAQDLLVAEKQQAYDQAKATQDANTDEALAEGLKAATETAYTALQTEIGMQNVKADELRRAEAAEAAARQTLEELNAKKDTVAIQATLDAKNTELVTAQEENTAAQQELKDLQDFVNDPANAVDKETAQKNYDAAKAVLEDAQKAYDAAKAKVDATQQDAKFLDMTAKNLKLKEEYDALVAKVAAEDAQKPAQETVTLNADGTLKIEEGYAYKLIFNYNRQTPVTPPPPPPPPVTPPPPTPPITIPPDPVPLAPPPVPTFYTLVEDPVPHGSLPRRSGLYTLADDDVPLGKLPKTSGSRGAAAGSAGVLSLLAGAVLGLFGKKKKKEEK